MTPSRKRVIIAGALLLVVLVVGLVGPSGDRGPDPPFTATFVKHATNGVVIQLVNQGKSQLGYICYRPWAGLSKGMLAPEATAQVTMPAMSPVGRLAVSNSNSPDRIRVTCVRSSKRMAAVDGALHKIGIPISGSVDSWNTWVDLPPPP